MTPLTFGPLLSRGERFAVVHAASLLGGIGPPLIGAEEMTGCSDRFDGMDTHGWGAG